MHVTSLLASEHIEFLCWWQPWLPETKVRTQCSFSLAFNSCQPISSQHFEDLWRDSQCEIPLPSCYPFAFEAKLLMLAVPMAAAGCWLLSYQSVWFKSWVWKSETGSAAEWGLGPSVPPLSFCLGKKKLIRCLDEYMNKRKTPGISHSWTCLNLMCLSSSEMLIEGVWLVHFITFNWSVFWSVRT